jgi:transposase-like protein
MNCIHCQSEAIVKNGTKTLKTGQVLQQYLCNTCGRRFNERSGTPMARLRTPVTTVEMALNARHEGLGIRAVARVVGTSPSNTAFPSLVRYEFRSEATVQQEFQGLDCTSRE